MYCPHWSGVFAEALSAKKATSSAATATILDILFLQ
jgi:hypothetical protein